LQKPIPDDHLIISNDPAVATGINENLLRLKRIEATGKFANSQNMNTIIVDFGKDGLPIIFETK